MSDQNEAPAEETQDEGAGKPAEVEDSAALGDAGKQALDRMKAERNKAKLEAAELKARLDKLEAANMSELERAQKEAADAREAATKAAADALRFRVAAQHGINDDDADLFLTGSDEDTLKRQALRLLERTPSSPRPDPSQGAKPGDLALNGDPLLRDLKTKLGIT